MVLSWLASFIQLATIIGAFTAGVILHDDYFKTLESNQKANRTIYHLLSPLEFILAPMFFIVIGIQVKLESFYHWNVLVLALGLLFAAVVGKLLSGWGANSKDDRIAYWYWHVATRRSGIGFCLYWSNLRRYF